MPKMSKGSMLFFKKVFYPTSKVYFIGCVGWVGVWYLVDGQVYPSKGILWLPYLSTYIILIPNMILRRFSDEENVENKEHENNNVKGKYDIELKKMQYIEKNAAHMVTAITGVLIISAAISAMKNTEMIPKEAIMFESLALILAVVGVLPKYWIPSTKDNWLNWLRHYKTVFYTFSISLFLGGLLLLLEWM
ncbi:MAG: hypothetical protein KAR40_17050 [Candidatus Sabulitectum sp.]|nr:hypothetical protein [Candidatus Sabulitectum sp.]